MNAWPDETLAKQMLTDADIATEQYSRGPLASAVASCACHVRALLTRVRELEKREAELIANAAAYARTVADWHSDDPK